MTSPLTEQQLDEYEALIARTTPLGAVTASPSMPRALLTEVRRLQAELERRTEDTAFLERTTLPELRRQIEHHKAGKLRWRDRAAKAETRVRELERPDIEAARNEIRQSFAELIAQAREARDHEGAFNVQCQLRDREEQWKREDSATTARPAV